MTTTEHQNALCYGTHTSTRKEAGFIHQGIYEQAQSGQAVVFTLSDVCDLPKLWLLPENVIM